MSRIILLTDTSLPAAQLAAYRLAAAGHSVYAGIPDARGCNAELLTAFIYHAREHAVDLYPVELDASSSASLAEVRALIVATHGHLDDIVYESPNAARCSRVRLKPLQVPVSDEFAGETSQGTANRLHHATRRASLSKHRDSNDSRNVNEQRRFRIKDSGGSYAGAGTRARRTLA
jgi:hypothetical protein